jgi:hypothetical protein
MPGRWLFVVCFIESLPRFAFANLLSVGLSGPECATRPDRKLIITQMFYYSVLTEYFTSFPYPVPNGTTVPLWAVAQIYVSLFKFISVSGTY